MAIVFLEPGGDATFDNARSTVNNGLWNSVNSTVSVQTDFVPDWHLRSLKASPNAFTYVNTVIDTGPGRTIRISFYFYLVSLPSASANILYFNSSFTSIRISSGGLIGLLTNGSLVSEYSSALSTGVWYRLSISYHLRSNYNIYAVYLDGNEIIREENSFSPPATFDTSFDIGNRSGNLTLDFRFTDIYVDQINSLDVSDVGNVKICAKRPYSNGSTNDLDTQIGASGSGYGTGHSSQVNERVISISNGWSKVVSGSSVSELYNIEGISVGDIDITKKQIIGILGWCSMSSTVATTANIVINNNNYLKNITTSNSVYTQVVDIGTYLNNSGSDIGIVTSSTAATFSLYELGVIIAYLPQSNTSSWLKA